MTRPLGIRELRADLATHVRRAAAGQQIIVTVGGRPAATLGPPTPTDANGQTLDILVASGLVVAPRRPGLAPRAAPVPIWSGVRLDRALGELRG
jgi:prevent-host-death family protein